jgi:hypothetical protein
MGLAWVLMQRRAIEGGAFGAWLRTLPVAPLQQRGVDIAVLLAADTPLFLPAGAALIALSYGAHRTTHELALACFALAVVAIQRTALTNGVRAWPWLIPLNLCLAAGCANVAPAQPAWIVAALLLALAGLMRRMPAYARPVWRIGRGPSRTAPLRPNRRTPLAVALVALSYRVLRDEPARFVARCGVMAALMTGASALAGLWNFDARAQPLSLLADALAALIAAGAYRDLHRAHTRAAQLMRPLPVHSAAQAAADIALVCGIALPFVAALALVLSAQGAASLPRAAGGVLGIVPLIAALRLPQRFAERQTMLAGAVLAALWVALAMRMST